MRLLIKRLSLPPNRKSDGTLLVSKIETHCRVYYNRLLLMMLRAKRKRKDEATVSRIERTARTDRDSCCRASLKKQEDPDMREEKGPVEN